ncbi:helix-turn-helix transcriptional regulator [Mariniluteicoccus flavus]
MENIEPVLGPQPVADPATRLSSARAAILAYLVDAARPVTVKEIAASSGQHANTVREHLEALTEFGMVGRESAKPIGRGRPAITYAVLEDAEPLHGTREYVSLVDALAGHIRRTSDDPRGEAIEAGRAWGRTLPEAEPVKALAGMGFRPVHDEEGVRLTQCPLLSSARRNPEVVCNVHLGLLKELAGEDADIEPFVPGGCMVHLPKD